MKLLQIILLILTFKPILVDASSQELITVKLGVLEAFASFDSTATQRYKEFYEAAINYALGENDRSLAKCGYRFQIIRSYFDNSDSLAANDAAMKLNSAWTIIGPVRSGHFLLAAKALNKTPMISPMAQAKEIVSANPPLFTMGPGMDVFAKAALKALENEKFGNSYGVFVDPKCHECRDFVESFGRFSKGKFQKVFSLDTTGEIVNLKDLTKVLSEKKIDFLILPNYSKFSGNVISEIHMQFPMLKFLGADGWGQGIWSFFPAFKISPSAIAISVRSGRLNEEMAVFYNINSLSQERGSTILPPPCISYALVELIRNIKNDLCMAKPKNKEEFTRFLGKQSNAHFRTKLGTGVYKLVDGQLQYAYKGIE